MKFRKWTDKQKNYIWLAVLCAVMILNVALMLTLCADEGIDYDESYSFKTARDFTHLQIPKKMIDDFDTDVPLYYNALRLWITLFGGIGHTFFAARLFSIAGAVASMLLGILVIRRVWGNRTALFYMLAVGLAPAMLHVSVNIRMYSWTNFLLTSAALMAYFLVQNPNRRWLWILLGASTIVGLFSHYFTSFGYLAVYLYLLIALFVYDKKQLWKVFACGGCSLLPLLIWMKVSGFFHFVKEGGEGVEIKPLSLKNLFVYLFRTDMKYWAFISICLLVCVLVGGILFFHSKEGRKGEKAFALTCMLSIFGVYLLALFLSSFASHFFTARHIMHITGMMWLGMAILLPRINFPAYLSGLLVLCSICCSNYRSEYVLAYRDTPYLEDTKKFIADEMQPGDIVIYSSPKMYSNLYSCYMPEQQFIHIKDLKNPEELSGKRVWFFMTNYFDYHDWKKKQSCSIHEENVGHYGFQIMSGFTDFDLLFLEIGGAD